LNLLQGRYPFFYYYNALLDINFIFNGKRIKQEKDRIKKKIRWKVKGLRLSSKKIITSAYL